MQLGEMRHCGRVARTRQSFGQGSAARHTIGAVTRVLLVEDDRDIAEPLARALDSPPDLIILDMSWLRKKLGDPPLISTVRRVGFRFER